MKSQRIVSLRKITEVARKLFLIAIALVVVFGLKATVNAASSSDYITVKADVPIWSDHTTSSTRVLGNPSGLPKGYVLKIKNDVSYTNPNVSDGVWYQIESGSYNGKSLANAWVWSENIVRRYTIKYNANGGTGAPSTQYKLHGNSVTLSSKKPTRTGYIFQNWCTSKTEIGTSYNPGSTYSKNADVTLFAIWKKCSSHNYVGGICSKCGFEYELTITSLNATFIVTNSDGAPIRTRPYAKNSEKIRTAAFRDALTVVAQTKNQEGNTWYKLSDGNWVWSDHVARQYTVKYNANGGSPTPANQYKVGTASVTVAAKPQKTGYIFQYWCSKSDGSGDKYNPGSSYSKAADVTLYAIWKTCSSHSYVGGICSKCGFEYVLTNVKSLNATFVVSNSDGAPIWSRPYTKNSKKIRTAAILDTLTVVQQADNQEGNTWYKLSDGNWVFSGNVTRRYTVKYNANGGTPTPANQYKVGTASVTVAAKPQKTGYIFQYWNSKSDGSGDKYTPGSSYSKAADVTLYAIWKTCSSHSYVGGICSKCDYEWPLEGACVNATYMVTNSDGAQIWSRPYSENSKKIRIEAKGKVLAVTETAKNQLGKTWYKLSDGNWVYSGNVTRCYAVKYNANGGSGAPSVQYKLKGKSITVSGTKPSKTGYLFQAWNSKSDGSGDQYTAGKSSYSKDADITLYAIWKTCSPHSYVGGICSKCGYEYPLTVESLSGPYIVTASGGAAIRNRPYTENSKTVRTDVYGKALTVTGRVNNQKGETWYKLSDGNWVYANQVTKAYRVNYVLDGGTNNSANPAYCYIGQIVSLKDPSRAGYTFDGWYTAASGGSRITSLVGSANTTVYARWSTSDDLQLITYLNYSGRNYISHTDFSEPLDLEIIGSRDESVAVLSIDSSTRHNGYNSLRITNYSAGAHAKDMYIRTNTQGREEDGYLGDNKTMVLSFYAKATNPGTTFYVRWGYGGMDSYRSATISTDWQRYYITLPKTSGCNQYLHPYIDRAGTVWISELQLEDGSYPTAFVPETEEHYQVVTARPNSSFQLPADPSRSGYTFDGWYTAASNGSRVTSQYASGHTCLYAHWTKILDPLAKPVLTLGANKSNGTINVSWTSVPEASEYWVYRTIQNSDDTQRIAVTSECSMVDNGVSPGWTYYYYVVARDPSTSRTSQSDVKNIKCVKATSIATATVTGVKNKTYTGKAITQAITVTLNGRTLKVNTDYTVTYQNNVNVGTATVAIRGKGNYTGSVTKTFQIMNATAKPSYTRLYGADRYATSLKIADAYKKELGVSKFSTICVADGVNFPDALAGAYFAYINKAPIIDVRQNAPTGEQTMNAINYIKKNLNPGGKIYVLGGPGSVPDSVVAKLKAAGFSVTRLWGQNRYGSNLAILEAAGIKGGTEFIVTTGTDFPDALTASATKKPVLLVVGKTLTADQKAYLAGAAVKSFTIVGSTKEVSTEIEKQLKTYAPVSRIAAASAYDRSIAVAKKYFPATVNHINIADGRNFPDALCGGPLAAKKGGPLFLTDGSSEVDAKIRAYAKAAKTTKATVYGGPASVSDASAKYILGIN